jgi:trehalose-6-phosphatase
VGLAAENGFFWRWDSINKLEQDWNTLMNIDDDSMWMNQVRLIMESYSQNTFGSYIDQLDSIITWNFKNTDIEYGKL